MIDIKEMKFNADGLIPAIVQDVTNGEVLMLAYMNEESLQKSIDEGKTWFWSRSRQEFWNKGANSGNVQKIVDMLYDCDADTILVKVIQTGNACHTGEYSCFHNYIMEGEKADCSDGGIVDNLYAEILDRKANPQEGSYTNYLFDKGIDKILKKVGEESAEVIIGAKNNDKQEVIYESCDLIYHMMVMMVEQGVTLDQIRHELNSRHVK